MKTGLYTLLAIFGFTALLLSPSCRPDDPPKLIIVAEDSAKAKVSGATVVISSEGTNPSTGVKQKGIITASGVTDGNGEASFEFKLPANLKVYAYKVINNDSIKATTNAKIVMDETSRVTVTLKRN